MKSLLCLCLILLTASQLSAETYSWVDDSGVWNFSDDFNSVPKKYRKNVGRRADADNSQVLQNLPELEKSQAPALKSEPATEINNKQLYNGKTHGDWRKEFDAHEVELQRLEQRLVQMQAVLKKPVNTSRSSLSSLLAEYEALRVEYKEKYRIYSELMESARRAGLTVEMKK
jgi:hypothetical protein